MSSHSIRQIQSFVNQVQSQLSLAAIQEASSAADDFRDLQERLVNQIGQAAAAIQASLASRNLSPADLAIRSRRAYQWLLFLSEQETLASHLDALQRINLYLPRIKPAKGTVLQFAFYHQGPLYKIRQDGGIVSLSAQESFIRAPDGILQALLLIALAPPSPDSRQAVRDFTFQEPYQRTRHRLEYLGIPLDSYAAGSMYHLGQIFDRVNQAYFEGRLARPHLVWSSRLTHRKFGHYQWDTDTVMVSSSLDQPSVPALAVEFVMYHELLHKKLGARRGKRNRIAHTSRFRQLEDQFKGIDEARRLLNSIARKGARRS